MTATTEPMILRAGQWQATLVDGALSAIRLGETEVLRDLMIVVRDDAWATVPGSVELVAMDQTEAGFAVRLRGRHAAGALRFEWKALLVGAHEGITFSFDGRALTGFRSNRIGFVALHPLGWAGRPVVVIHSDGGRSETRFPTEVSPHQPFVDVVGLRQPLGASVVSIDFEGEVFETEDQRNWSDASYKTYSRPLALPFPVVWDEGDTMHQMVRLSLSDRLPASAESPRSQPDASRARSSESAPSASDVLVRTAHLGEPVTIPLIGLTVGPDDDVAAVASELSDLNPAHLRIDVVASGERLIGASGLRSALSSGWPLELAVHVGENAHGALSTLSVILEEADLPLSALLIFDLTAPATTPRSVDAVRSALGRIAAEAPVWVGTDDNLAEINRNRIAPDSMRAVGIAFSLNPAVHDLRTHAVISTAEAIPAMIETARGFGTGAVALSPITLRPRRNIYREGATIDRMGRDDASVDERQYESVGAAWLVATLITAIMAGADRLTLLEISGPRGVIQRAGGDRSPMFDVVAAFCRATGIVRCRVGPAGTVETTLESSVEAVVLNSDDMSPRVLVLCNRSSDTRSLVLDSGERVTVPPFDVTLIPLPYRPADEPHASGQAHGGEAAAVPMAEAERPSRRLS